MRHKSPRQSRSEAKRPAAVRFGDEAVAERRGSAFGHELCEVFFRLYVVVIKLFYYLCNIN